MQPLHGSHSPFRYHNPGATTHPGGNATAGHFTQWIMHISRGSLAQGIHLRSCWISLPLIVILPPVSLFTKHVFLIIIIMVNLSYRWTQTRSGVQDHGSIAQLKHRFHRSRFVFTDHTITSWITFCVQISQSWSYHTPWEDITTGRIHTMNCELEQGHDHGLVARSRSMEDEFNRTKDA
jgi:hypothetical protein